MWQVKNRTPYEADRCFVRDRDGAEVWIVAVRATFDVSDQGDVTLADEQLPVVLEPQYIGEPGLSSLRYDTDLILDKPAVDFLVLGHARTPDGRPRTQLDVAVQVAERVKTIHVIGDRIWESTAGGLRLPPPLPFLELPITYENAYGGTVRHPQQPDPLAQELFNPVGRGVAIDKSQLAGKPAPNLELPSDPVRSWNQRIAPVAFGPLGWDWRPRRDLAGTYDDAWEKSRMPLLPTDLDLRFYQSAPPDQQLPPRLRRGTMVGVHNMWPGRETHTFALPEVHLGFRTYFGRKVEHHPGRLHTIIIEPDERRLQMIWHSRLRCHGREHELDSTVVVSKKAIA